MRGGLRARRGRRPGNAHRGARAGGAPRPISHGGEPAGSQRHTRREWRAVLKAAVRPRTRPCAARAADPITADRGGALFVRRDDLRSLVQVALRDGKLNYASVGVGSYHHMALELLKKRAGFPAEDIPYKGQGPAIQQVIGGQVPCMVIGAAGLPQVTSGKLKALGVLSQQRIAALPNVATASEHGITDAEVYAWVGMAAPRETPEAVMPRVSDELRVSTRGSPGAA